MRLIHCIRLCHCLQWAHRHWVWISAKESNQTSVLENLDGYTSRNISVGAIDVDSGWSTGFNNFVVDTVKV